MNSRRAAVDTDDRTLIADQQNDFRVIGIDPDVLVIVAAWRARRLSQVLPPSVDRQVTVLAT